MSNTLHRQFIVCRADADPQLLENYLASDAGWLDNYFLDRLRLDVRTVMPLPTFQVEAAFKSIDGKPVALGSPPPPDELVVPVLFSSADAVKNFREQLALGPLLDRITQQRVVIAASADIAIDLTDHWCPVSAGQYTFDDATAAHGLINLPQFRAVAPQCDGRGVNVVIIDQGLNKHAMDALTNHYHGGWRVRTNVPPAPAEYREPGTAPANGHGMMMARAIHAIAPGARFFDLPMIPERIGDVSAFVSLAREALRTVYNDIHSPDGPPQPGHWVFVNAWSVLNTAFETMPGDYTQNPGNPMSQWVQNFIARGHDMIFAASNCGQFCPHARCGRLDRGPGRSILGANALPQVITVGGVRTDATWIGYSSQGPGAMRGAYPKGTALQILAKRKPNISAPTHFKDNSDGRFAYTGTSAACGVVAGAVAALRSATGITPEQLRDVLQVSARRPGPPPGFGWSTGGGNWDERLGYGVLDLAAAYRAIAGTAQAAE